MPVQGCEMPNLPLADGCAILSVPVNLSSEVTRRVGTVYANPTHCDKEFGLHTHTVRDEYQTICNRHLKETPVPDLASNAWHHFVSAMRKLSRRIGSVRSATLASVMSGKTGRRRKRFMQGAMELAVEGITKRDSKITEMQKLEMYEANKLAVKEDRGIQYRSVKYNVALARELHNVERRVIGMHENGTHPVMKGATPQQRAERLAMASLAYKVPLYLLMDHSRFDAHVSIELLREEHKFYLRCRKGSKYLARLLRSQLLNKGKSKGGIKYVSKGKRMSGDINTGLGNTILNYCIIKAWLNASGVKGTIFLDGDDSVVIIENDDYGKLLPLEEFMLKLGMVTEMEKTNEFWKVEFCQSRPVLVDGTVRFVRNPHKVLATVGRSAENVGDDVMEEVVRASCMCELAMNGNCPVISPYCRRLLKITGDGPCRYNASQLWKAEQYGIHFSAPETDVISDESRITFWRAWGIDAGMQEALEQQDIECSSLVGKGKKRKVRTPRADVDPTDDWSGAIEPECGCGECPSYDSSEAYEAACLWKP
nr:hypothetical protein [Leuven Tombus-like virus 4]